MMFLVDEVVVEGRSFLPLVGQIDIELGVRTIPDSTREYLAAYRDPSPGARNPNISRSHNPFMKVPMVRIPIRCQMRGPASRQGLAPIM